MAPDVGPPPTTCCSRQPCGRSWRTWGAQSSVASLWTGASALTAGSGSCRSSCWSAWASLPTTFRPFSGSC
eukprot:8978660-Pyramimonas_sp.AAC.1